MDGQAIECPQPADSPLLVEVYDLPSFDLIETHSVQVPPAASFNMVSAMTPDGQRLTRIRPVPHEGQTTRIYEIMDPETFAIIESVSVDATWQRGSFAPSNSGYVIAYLSEERRVILENPMTGAELLSLSQPGHSYQGYKYRFDQEDHYFGVLGTSSSLLELYAVADCYVTTDREINLRSGPGTEFDSPTTMQPGERLAVDGQSQQGNYTWWHLAVGLWVREDVVKTQGNC
jgi:hypothetical protein